MEENQYDVITTIDGIYSVEDVEELERLQKAVEKFFERDHPEQIVDVLFRIFERFPDSDGHGIFWTMLHGIETLPGYENQLLKSVDLCPSRFTLLMVIRLLNAKVTEINGRNLFSALEAIAADVHQTEVVRAQARDYIADWQLNRNKNAKTNCG